MRAGIHNNLPAPRPHMSNLGSHRAESGSWRQRNEVFGAGPFIEDLFLVETISRQMYGFRNFENYRPRVQVLCSQEVLGLGFAPVFGVEP